MIGNDIIDLRLAARQSNWRRNGFLKKLYTDRERYFILNSQDPFQLVWQFWSMKESAYKAFTQQYDARFFAPKKFECTLKTPTDGFVQMGQEQYNTTSKITKAFIFTHTKMRLGCIDHDHFEIGAGVPTRQVLYTAIKKNISSKFRISINDLNIKKNTFGVPKLVNNNEQLVVSFSISHHGRYGAYSILNT